MAKSSKSIGSKLPVRRSVELPQRRVLRVGRNEPCPCGSGRKYKECHQSEGTAYLEKMAKQQEKDELIEKQRKQGVAWYRRLWTKYMD